MENLYNTRIAKIRIDATISNAIQMGGLKYTSIEYDIIANIIEIIEYGHIFIFKERLHVGQSHFEKIVPKSNRLTPC